MKLAAVHVNSAGTERKDLLTICSRVEHNEAPVDIRSDAIALERNGICMTA